MNCVQSAPQPHLQIFNHLQTSRNADSTFPNFSLLPPELRSLIWWHALQRERLIKIYFQKQLPSFTPKRLKPDGKMRRYQLMVDGRKSLSRLLRVNHESRQAALRFYRVKVPCILSHSPEDEHVYESIGQLIDGKPGFLYFNPEHDFLEIASDSWRGEDLFDLAYHLKKTYDPFHVGLLNLAIRSNSLVGDVMDIDPADVNAQVRQVFQETLAQLREVFFITRTRAGRHILGKINGIPKSDPRNCVFNRSFPIATVSPAFERLQHDPRAISKDLKQQSVERGPERMAYHWQCLLDRWNVSASQITYQFILAFVPFYSYHEIQDGESASRWLQKEEDEWTGKWRLDDEIKNGCWAKRGLGSEGEFYYEMVGVLDGDNQHEDLDKAVKPVFGFWMFPLRLFGKIPSSEKECNELPSKLTLDLSDHLPGLGMSLF